MIKKGKISANFVFSGNGNSTNKLHGQKVTEVNISNGKKKLAIDFSHYEGWKSNKHREPEYSDYIKMATSINNIEVLILNDKTVKSKLDLANIAELEITYGVAKTICVNVTNIIVSGSSTVHISTV